MHLSQQTSFLVMTLLPVHALCAYTVPLGGFRIRDLGYGFSWHVSATLHPATPGFIKLSSSLAHGNHTTSRPQRPWATMYEFESDHAKLREQG